MINLDSLKKASINWTNQTPFPHFIVDDFFEVDVAKQLEKEFPSFEENIWHEYGNAIEVKKVCNNWNAFPSCTYEAFSYLNSPSFVEFLSKCLFGRSKLYCDSGLNGGGWHIHSRGGKLNTHQDYSLHPKLGLQRKLNIIVYLNSEWQSEWGGQLGLWDNKSADAPGDLIKEIEPKFNRAAIFDTTCNSWHGLPNPLECPENQFRKSLAVYYLTEPPIEADDRGKALFAPTAEQQHDDEVLELIKKRSSVATASSVYSKKG
ncbi:2OG-Fe(II) oxygenase [Alphaproteobacteria bacterium]|nr:2OG-Fe(II) oxygenase [Alphaproteobacteria bacterium]